MPKATTVRFTDEVFARLDQASARTGLPVNSIVVAACLEWLALHVERTAAIAGMGQLGPRPTTAPRWATVRRAVRQAIGGKTSVYPFEQFTKHAQEFLVVAQGEAQKHGHSYIGTEHLLLAFFGNAGFHSAQVLARLGIEYASVDAKLASLLGHEKFEWRDRIVPTQRVKKIIELAFQLSGDAGDTRVGTHHVLLAISKEGNGIAARVLNDLGATLDRIESEVALLSEPES